MSEIDIRPASDEERDWAAVLFAGSEPWITLGATLDQCRAACGDPGNLVYIAHEEDTPCGALVLQTRGVAGSPYVKSIAVDERRRNRGVGAAMIGFAESLFRSEAKHLFLCVSSFNTRARVFYERLGFAAVGELPDYVIDGASEILMHKRLK